MPLHLVDQESMKVIPPTVAQIDELTAGLGIPAHPALDEDEKLMMKHLISFSWAFFDDVMRSVNRFHTDKCICVKDMDDATFGLIYFICGGR